MRCFPAAQVFSPRLRTLEERGRALAQFVERVRARGGHAETEEIDLLLVRVEYILERAALRPTLTTQPHARIFLSSSPMGRVDAHAVAFDQGETAFQSVAHAPTWEAHPAITEEATHALEPHEPTWRREYAAIPSDGVAGAFTEDDVAHLARALHPDSYALSAGAMFLDSSSGRGDCWAWCIAQYVVEPCGEDIYLTREVRDERGILTIRDFPLYGEDGRPIENPRYRPPRRVLFVSAMGALEGHFAARVSFSDVVAHVASVALAWGVTRCFGDQHLGFALESELSKHGIRFEQRPWTGPSKIESVSTARRLLRDRSVVVEPGEECEKMRRELLGLEEVFTPNGISVRARRTAAGHGDRASLFLLLGRADAEGEITGSPLARSNTVTSYDPYTHEVAFH